MLSVTSPTNVSEVREGVHRYYKIRRTRGISSWPLVTPPRAILQEFYRIHPEFTIDSDGLVGSVEKLEYASELNSTERVLFEALRSSPACLLDRSSLARSCYDYGMNPNTFSQYLTSSPVISHIGTDMWSLRGTKVDAAAVEALREANAARQTKDASLTTDGASAENSGLRRGSQKTRRILYSVSHRRFDVLSQDGSFLRLTRMA